MISATNITVPHYTAGFATCIVLRTSELYYSSILLTQPLTPSCWSLQLLEFFFLSGPPPLSCWFKIPLDPFLIGVHSRPFSDDDAECSSLLPINNAGLWISILMKEIINAYHGAKRRSPFANEWCHWHLTFGLWRRMKWTLKMTEAKQPMNGSGNRRHCPFSHCGPRNLQNI